jgi:hypothetical protein
MGRVRDRLVGQRHTGAVPGGEGRHSLQVQPGPSTLANTSVAARTMSAASGRNPSWSQSSAPATAPPQHTFDGEGELGVASQIISGLQRADHQRIQHGHLTQIDQNSRRR